MNGGGWDLAFRGRTVVVDVETTGLDVDDRIVTLGAILIDPGSQSIEGRHLIFNPGRRNHPRAFAVHGYDDRILRIQEPFAVYAAEVAGFVGSADRVVGHNLEFDLGFINRELSLVGAPSIRAEPWCTMQHHRAGGRGGSAALTSVAAALGLSRAGSRHGAIEDAWLALQVYLDQNGVRDPTIASEWSSVPPSNFRKGRNREIDRGEIDRVASMLLRSEPSVRPVPGMVEGGPAHDSEDAILSEQEADIDGLTIGIRYLDTSGAESTRTVRCYSLSRSADAIYLDAMCHMRQAQRRFRVDRIVDVFDYTTGEVLGSGLSFFRSRIPSDWDFPSNLEESGRPNLDLSTFQDAAKLLMYMAMEDGSLHPAEYHRILSYSLDQLLQSGTADLASQAAAAEWIRNYVPTERAAKIALGKLMAAPDAGKEVANLLIDVLLADGKATDEEMQAAWKLVDYMEKREGREKR